MGEPGPLIERPSEPDVFFLPLSVPEPYAFDDPDAGVLSRRLPHFLHLLLNEGGACPTGLLEVQSPPDEGPRQWITLQEPIDPNEAMDLLPDGESVRAIVTGVLTRGEGELRLELTIHLANRPNHRLVYGRLSFDDPVRGVRDVVKALSHELQLPWFWPERGLLTESGDAFFKFLQGLDGAALITSDVEQSNGTDCEDLLQPFHDALAFDPTFGLALRTAHMTIVSALEVSRLGEAACYRAFDRCFETMPRDGEGCVAIAEHLAVLGDNRRAEEWLEHAAQLNPPPPRGLESLGILFANRGETVAARELWMRGVAMDGHPDFFAHLTRLAFSEDRTDDAWDMVLRGLRRIYERAVRAGEWTDDGRGSGLLLRYLVDHLDDENTPEEALQAIEDLIGVLDYPDDRVELGLCLLASGNREAAREEVTSGLSAGVDGQLRDLALRALLVLDMPDFEARFADAVEGATQGDDPKQARGALLEMLDLQPTFWPGLFFLGIAERRIGDEDRALDVMAEVLQVRPGQPDALGEMADLFAARGNPKRALECIDHALEEHSDDARMLASRARFLHALDRANEAREAIDRAIEIEPEAGEYRRLRQRIGS